MELLMALPVLRMVRISLGVCTRYTVVLLVDFFKNYLLALCTFAVVLDEVSWVSGV